MGRSDGSLSTMAILMGLVFIKVRFGVGRIMGRTGMGRAGSLVAPIRFGWAKGRNPYPTYYGGGRVFDSESPFWQAVPWEQRTK